MRFERDFQTADAKPLGREDFARLIAERHKTDDRTREEAIACYLAAADGSDEARQQLGGAFAEPLPGLSERREIEHAVNQRASQYFQRRGIKQSPVSMIKQV